LCFYSLGIKPLFPFSGSSPSDTTGPGYGRLFVQAPLDIADRPIPRSFRHSAYVIHGGSSLSNIFFSWEPHSPERVSVCSVKGNLFYLVQVLVLKRNSEHSIFLQWKTCNHYFSFSSPESG
jgi:hypothetical protein